MAGGRGAVNAGAAAGLRPQPPQLLQVRPDRRPALQEDEDKKYARLDLGVQHKWITVNEARGDIGLPPVEGGDELSQPVPPALQGFPGGSAAQGGGEEEEPGALSDGRSGSAARTPPPGAARPRSGEAGRSHGVGTERHRAAASRR